jgi:hypothetical protein
MSKEENGRKTRTEDGLQEYQIDADYTLKCETNID